ETQVTQDHVVEVSVVPTQVTSTHIPTTSSGYSSTTTTPRTPSIATAPTFKEETTTVGPMTIPFRPVTVPPPEVQTFMATTQPPATTQTVQQPVTTQTTTPAAPTTTNRIIFSHGFAPQQPAAPAQPSPPVHTQIIVAPATVARPNPIVLSNAVTPQVLVDNARRCYIALRAEQPL
ncbi:hypothetical protein ANCCAN_18301, partial [Ancylostoma caninum]